MDKIDELIERYTGGGRCFLQPESKKHFAEDLKGLLAEAIAERDAGVKKLEAENDRLLHELSDATWREAKVQGELHRIKEGVRELPVVPVKRTASFESVDVVSTIDMIQKTDLDRLMKGGE